MTRQQSQEIRELVDNGGWAAVHSHPQLSKVWAATVKAEKTYTDSVVDR